jgi:CO/xanthine dehydrogenase FAD-binding subunit
MLLRDENGLLAQGVTKESAKDFAKYVSEHTPTAKNLRGSAEYRSHLTRVLTERSVNELGGM